MVVLMLSYFIRIMDPNSSLGKICLGENVVEISSDKVEGSGDWNSPEFQNTANNGQKKETKSMVFHQMDTEEVSDRFMAPCFVNGLEAYDGDLGVEENMISNVYTVKLCLEHEFIINPEEDDAEPGVILGRAFLRMTKSITNFGAGTVTIYPDIDPFLEDTEEEEKSMDEWDHLLNFKLDDIPLLGEKELPQFVCKMGKGTVIKKRSMENLSLFYQYIGTSLSAGGHLTQEEAAKEALAIRISQKFALLEEVRLVIETMAYHDKYKKILDEIWKDKVELDEKIVKKEEEAVERIKGKALKEKDDPRAFIFPIRLEGQVNKNALADTRSDINTMPYRIYNQLGREKMKKVDRGITVINQTQAEAMRILTNILCQVGVTTLIAKFLILDIQIDRDAPIVVGRGFLRTISGIVNTSEIIFSTFDGFCHQTFRAARFDVIRNAESDSDDEEEYEIKKNKFGALIYGPKPTPYLNCNNPAERSLAIQTVTNPFRNISVWKKAVSFFGSLPVPLKHVNWKPDYKGYYTKEEEAIGQWRTEIRLTDLYGNIYLQGFTIKKTDRKLSKYHKLSDIMSPNLWEHTMMRPDHQDPNALDNMKPWKRYCSHKFIMSSCSGKDAKEMQKIDDMLRIRLRKAESNELGLYHADELEEDGFNIYFEGGLRSDEHFNAQEYWLSISREENLGLSRTYTSTIRSPILRVIHNMITYDSCQRMTGYNKIQKNNLWFLSMFDARHQNGKSKALTNDVVRSLSASIYCRDLDTTPLRDLIDFEGRLIPEDPQPGVPRVGTPRPPRASMQDLYDRMVFEHMDGVYSVPLQGAYNLPGYAQPQYGQYYQQYPPPAPQYPPQQDDDE
ncbi:ribonuclease H-like domain-containing protein [Tanacetum coccineum]